MPKNSEPSTAIEAYKAIIDELVTETSYGVSERLLREDGIYSKAPDNVAGNELAKSLTFEQKQILADMLHQERVGAIAEVLAVFTWWLVCRQVGLTFKCVPMPFELSGEGLHGDYIGRINGWNWPSDDITAVT